MPPPRVEVGHAGGPDEPGRGGHDRATCGQPRRALPVDLDELADLLEGGDDVRFGLVDLRTGEVSSVFGDVGEYLGLGEGFDPDEDPDRWLVVRRVGSRAAYQDMVAFIEQVNDPAQRDRLEIAISGKGAFRRFKDVLARDEAELHRFFAFTNDRKRERARRLGSAPRVPRRDATSSPGHSPACARRAARIGLHDPVHRRCARGGGG